jgi:hypothetical protein
MVPFLFCIALAMFSGFVHGMHRDDSVVQNFPLQQFQTQPNTSPDIQMSSCMDKYFEQELANSLVVSETLKEVFRAGAGKGYTAKQAGEEARKCIKLATLGEQGKTIKHRLSGLASNPGLGSNPGPDSSKKIQTRFSTKWSLSVALHLPPKKISKQKPQKHSSVHKKQTKCEKTLPAKSTYHAYTQAGRVF